MENLSKLHRFKIGQIVAHTGGRNAEILEIVPFEIAYHHSPLYKIKMLGSGAIMVLEELWFTAVCECGASHTSTPDDHMMYCGLRSAQNPAILTKGGQNGP